MTTPAIRRLLQFPAVLIVLLAVEAPAGAATITACGPNVCYEYDPSQTAVLLTGTPTLVGDDMEFLPPAFIAHSTGLAGWTTTTANFIFSRVWTVNPLNEIATFHTFEEFDYEIINDGEVRARLYTQARSNLNSLDGTNSGVLNWSAVGDSSGAQIATLNAYLYPATAFTNALATDMRVTIQNTLKAYTDAVSEDAMIQKKFTLVTVTTTPTTVVPVPGAAWLLASALGLLGWLRRKLPG